MPSRQKLIESGLCFKIENEVEWLPRIISLIGGAKSNGEALRLIKAGAVSLNGEKIIADRDDLDVKIDRAVIVKVGKRRFFLIYHDEKQLKDIK